MQEAQRDDRTEATLIPVASGKGGVGKTFVTANLALALAAQGHRTVAVDLDLGGSNLHSFLGLPNRYAGVGDFLKARSAPLEDLLVPVEQSNLRFLPGDGRSPFMANVPYAQKMRLLNHLRRLPADYILLDLGAGTTFNTLDFFRVAPLGMLVTVPEYPSIMGMLTFMKQFLLRAIDRSFADDLEVRGLLKALHSMPMDEQQKDIRDLRTRVAEVDDGAGTVVEDLCRTYRPRIVFNMGRHPDELKIARSIADSLHNVLDLEADYFGFIFDDPEARSAARSQKPFLLHAPDSPAAESISKIAERIAKYWDAPVDNSAERLMRHTRQVYESRQGR